MPTSTPNAETMTTNTTTNARMSTSVGDPSALNSVTVRDLLALFTVVAQFVLWWLARSTSTGRVSPVASSGTDAAQFEGDHHT